MALQKLFGGKDRVPSVPAKELKDTASKFILDVREPDEVAAAAPAPSPWES